MNFSKKVIWNQGKEGGLFWTANRKKKHFR